MNLIRTSFISLTVLLATLAGNAAVTVQASLDSVHVVMGRITTLHLTVTQPAGTRGNLLYTGQLRENGIWPACGDSVEFRAPSKIDTLVSGNTETLKFDIPVQSFDSGYYRLPELVYVAGNDTLRSKALSLKVVPVKVNSDTPIDEFASTAQPENPSIFDHVPDWVLDYWWILLILLLAIAAFIYAMRRYRREGHLLPQKPQPTPYEIAIEALRQLKERKLWEQGLEKDYYTQLTDILRNYLEGRFAINAMEMTSRQILHALNADPEIREKKQMIRQILDMADFVKFAKVRPLPEDNVKSYDNALQFVRDTKPQPPAAEGQEEKYKLKDSKEKGGEK